MGFLFVCFVFFFFFFSPVPFWSFLVLVADGVLMVLALGP